MLKSVRARRLSKKGEHAAALALCMGKDVEVLSRAGMHLSVLAQSARPSIFCALALAQTGNFEQVIKLARRFVNYRHSRRLLGTLAVVDPARVLPLIQGRRKFDDIFHYCQAMTGEQVLGNRLHIKKLPTLLGLLIALKAGKTSIAKELFERTFTNAKLNPPEVNVSNGRFDVNSLRGGRGEAIEGGALISVVLTAYNEEEYLLHAAKSVLEQDWRNLELIIVDDGSTDNTHDIALEVASHDNRVRVIRLDENVGLWRAKNMAFQHARGELITMHDADDWSHPAKLKMQAVPLLQNHKLACTSSNFFRVDQETGHPYTRNAESILRWNPSSLMFRRDLLGQIGNFFIDILGSDCEFVARIETIFGVKSHYKVTDIPLSVGWQRAQSLSNKCRSQVDGTGGGKRIRDWEAWRKLHAMSVIQETTGMFGKNCKLPSYAATEF